MQAMHSAFRIRCLGHSHTDSMVPSAQRSRSPRSQEDPENQGTEFNLTNCHFDVMGLPCYVTVGETELQRED